MKKLLSIAAAAALLFTSVSADDTITITGEVLPSAVVGFADVSGETLTGTDKFVDASIDLGSHAVDVFNGALENATQDVYVKTNIAAGNLVTMAITSGNVDKNTLLDLVSSETIPVVYKLGTTEFKTDGTLPLTVASAANDGGTAIADKFTVTTSATATQLAGTYGATLNVDIVAN